MKGSGFLIDRVTDLVCEGSKVGPNLGANDNSGEKHRGARWTIAEKSPKSSRKQVKGSKKWFSFRKKRGCGDEEDVEQKKRIGPNVLDPDFTDATFLKVNVDVYRKNHYLESMFHDLSDSEEVHQHHQ